MVDWKKTIPMVVYRPSTERPVRQVKPLSPPQSDTTLASPTQQLAHMSISQPVRRQYGQGDVDQPKNTRAKGTTGTKYEPKLYAGLHEICYQDSLGRSNFYLNMRFQFCPMLKRPSKSSWYLHLGDPCCGFVSNYINLWLESRYRCALRRCDSAFLSVKFFNSRTGFAKGQ